MYGGTPPYIPVALTDKYGDIVEETKDPTPVTQLEGISAILKNKGTTFE